RAKKLPKKTRLQQPVKLQPSWEENNLPEDELNFKNLTMDDASLQLNTPPDKYNLVYITFLIHGIGVLMPWNMFITAKNLQLIGNESKTGTQIPCQDETSKDVQIEKINVWGTASICIDTLNADCAIGKRTYCVTVKPWFAKGRLMNNPNLVLKYGTRDQAAGMGDVKKYFTFHKLSEEYIGFIFPYVPNFMQYLTFSSQVPNVIFNWMNIFVQIGGNLTTRIVWSISIEVIVFILTIVLAMSDTQEWPYGFFYITMICVVILNMANGIYQNTIFGMAAKLPGKYTGAVVLGSNISGTFTAIVDILSREMTSNTRMAAIYYFITALFVLLICFDTYFALPLNRYYRHFELKEKKDLEQRRQITKGMNERIPYLYVLKKSLPQLYNVFFVFFVTLSVFPSLHSGIVRYDKDFLIPDEYFTAGCPAISFGDWAYWIVAITMGLTSGYFSSLGMMYTPRLVEERYAATAGMFAAAALITGIFTGILMSFLWPWVIAHVGN
ncbi:hypothetical protein NQ317_004369, partial [Molorchus minor]